MIEVSKRFLFEKKFDATLQAVNSGGELHYVYTEIDYLHACSNAEKEGYSQGFEKGFEEGKQHREEETHQLLKHLLKNIESRVVEIFEHQQTLEETIFSKTILLSQVLLQKLLPSYVASHGFHELSHTLNSIFLKLKRVKSFFLYIHPSAAPIIREQLSYFIDANEGRLIIVEKEEMSLYSFELEWDGGGAFWNLDDLFKHLDVFISETSTAEK